MLIYIKGCYTLAGRIDSSPEQSKYSFKVSDSNKASSITVIIEPSQRSIEAYNHLEISQETFDSLNTGIESYGTLHSTSQNELSKIEIDLSEATKRVLKMIKFGLEQECIAEQLFLVKGYFWSKDNVNWKELPNEWCATMIPLNRLRLNKETQKDIQIYISNNDYEPFFCFKASS